MHNFNDSAAKIKETILHFKGLPPVKFSDGSTEMAKGLLTASALKNNILVDMKEGVFQMNSLRGGGNNRACVDVDTATFYKEKFGMGSMDSFYDAIDLVPADHTIHSLTNMGDIPDGYRWIVPEIFLAAIRLGYRRTPIYPDFIAAEENVPQPTVTLPSINMSAADPTFVGEGDTISVGNLSFNKKTFGLKKIGSGIKFSDEVQKFVNLNIVSIYMQDFGVKLGLGLDTMAFDVLLNGEQVDGGMSAPSVGVDDPNIGIAYNDLMRGWITLGQLGRTPTGMVSNKEAAITLMGFPEFKGANYNNVKQNINFKTPIPSIQDFYIHGAMPAGNILGMVSKTGALIKLNAQGLMVESERIASRQINGTYATVMTGFAKMFRDSFIIIDGTLALNANPYPTWMDVTIPQGVLIGNG